MEMEQVWSTFLKEISLIPSIASVDLKRIAGIPFLYLKITSPINPEILERSIRRCSSTAMKGKKLSSETIFVRSEQNFFVFRHRFLVPQRKMFCCGNLCVDCVRFNPNGWY
ncbi:hypothetical protein AM500_15865 [Bacillus sp. FJAT-18017]|uniref:hypothetical protein n=1 Tax=Bacillus sp. FJAT-18017 TaxID=1705566 RepID=UPI0006AE2F71|nr:hypothetical protein [Bacillus sp. FJAT-18017]ALC91104.1 hypothetical protein AM500_15865 [Bacillus sp. FJAT-18017]